MRAAITGASGFVGRAMRRALEAADHTVIGCGRGADADARIGDITDRAGLAAAMAGADVVIHLAARTHVMREAAAGALAAYRAVNVAGTRRVAEAAAEAGVRRIVYMSSAKVNGERTTERPFTEDDAPAPEDAYGITKREAEETLGEAAARSGIETVILRPPLVHGANVAGNFGALLELCDSPWWLPFGALTQNRRSFIHVANLADATLAAATHPAAADRVFLVRDGEDLSTAALVRRLRRALGRPERLARVPPGLLRAGLALAGRAALADRLAGSLTLDDSAIRRALGWRPPLGPDAAFSDTVRAKVQAAKKML